MKTLLKTLILLTRNQSIFSVVGLREFRWKLYRSYYNAPLLFVDDGVKIISAHISPQDSFECKGEVNLGQGVYIDYSGGVWIGEYVAISDGSRIYTHNHGIHGGNRNWKLNPISFSPLRIENFVWIGAGVIVTPSVKLIAEGSIVAAGAVLTKDTEPYGIYAGNPAKLIATRKIDDKEI